MSEGRNLVGNKVRFAVRAFSRCLPGRAACTSWVSPCGYKPCHRLTGSKLLCGTFMNPAPIPSLRHRCAVRENPRLQICGISVPLNGASACVRRGKGRHVGSEAPRLPSVLAAHQHRKQIVLLSPLLGDVEKGPKHVWKAKAVNNARNETIAARAFHHRSAPPAFRSSRSERHCSRHRRDRFGKSVSILTREILRSLGLYLKADSPALHFDSRHRPGGLHRSCRNATESVPNAYCCRCLFKTLFSLQAGFEPAHLRARSTALYR